ncbi:MAG TPA: hypothetical protein VHM91_05190 [Verrucomicrobiales bacterium]|nr:hypothetical protein [Verrucomicrobiales bacterium]
MTNQPASPGARATRRWPGIFAGLLLLAGAGGTFWKVWQTTQPDEGMLKERAAEKLRAEVHTAVDSFLNNDAKQVLTEAEKKDMQAVQRALDSLRACFKTYSGGIDEFTDSLTSWGMRSKIIYRSTVETIEQKDEHSWTAALVREKFAEHVLSDKRLETDVMEIMKQFAYDMEANRNEMLASLETRLSAAHLPATVRELKLNGFREQTRGRIQELLKSLPGQSVTVGVSSITAGIFAEEAVRQLIRTVIAQAAARIAASAAVSGGTAAGAAATGGAGGTAVAPGIGTAIGVAGGLIVGAVVDWWMTDKFKEKVAEQCRQFLTSTHVALVTGDKGLEKLLLDHVTSLGNASREAVAVTLAGAANAQPLRTP